MAVNFGHRRVRSQNYACEGTPVTKLCLFGDKNIFAKARRSQKYASSVQAMPLGFYCDPEPNLNQS